MDEIRCPMCGNLNPADLEECQYCQARLKPLIISQPPEDELGESDQAPSASYEEEGLPDWLRGLRAEGEGSADQEVVEQEVVSPLEEADDADWLSRLKDQSMDTEENYELEEAEEEPFDNGEFLLDRLGEANQASEPPTGGEELTPEAQEAEDAWSASAQPVDEDELPDWLSEIGSEVEPFDQDEAENVSEPPVDEEDVMPESQEVEVAWPASVQPVDEDEMPDWLSEIGSEAESLDQDEAVGVSESPGDEEELPEWFTENDSATESLEPDVDETAVSEQLTPSQEEEALPGWMAEIGSVADEERPDWMPEVEIDAKESEADEEAPSEADEGEEESGEPEVEPEEVPVWLEGLEGERPEKGLPGEEKPEVEAGEPEIEEAELPDWLADLQKDEAQEEQEEIPDWLPTDEAEEGAETEEELPDWLTQASEEESAEEISEEEVPEWLAGLEGEGVGESIELPEQEAEEEFEGEGTPEWLSDMEQEFSQGSVPPFVIEEEGEEQIAGETPLLTPEEESEDFLESLPEWAAEVSVEEEMAEEEQESELEEAELPSWLEAMRPVESVAPEMPAEEIADEEVETIGPLAGLSGILAAESDFARVRKPPAYSVKLRVTDNQQARLALLKEMLSTEDKQKTLPVQPAITPQYIFRLVIALALILPILFVSGSTLTPMPDAASVPSGVLDVRRQIDNQLSANSPVLIGFDYEAGFSGELDIPASAVISQLMDKGAYLVLVSTSPNGPLVAERLIDRLNQSPTRQDAPYSRYSNMGYIPGGTTGLLSLAQSPKQAVPYTLDNLVVWESAPLNLISTAADFSMVLVITENPETARAWVEQVQPILGTNETPLIMILSAQAEPLVRPYYDGSPKQLNGLIVGLPGGAAYESITGQSSLARKSWDAFSLSMLIAELILIVGAVASVGLIFYKSTQKEEG